MNAESRSHSHVYVILSALVCVVLWLAFGWPLVLLGLLVLPVLVIVCGAVHGVARGLIAGLRRRS